MYSKFLLLFLLCTSISFAADHENEYTATHQLNCVRKIYLDKIYLNENNLHITECGIFVDLTNEGNYVSLPELYSDASGCFVPIRADIPGIYGICPSCGGTTFLGGCGNSSCPSNQ